MRYLILILSVTSIIVAAKMITGIRFLFQTIKFRKSTVCVSPLFLYFILFKSFNKKKIGPPHGKVVVCIIAPWNVRKADDLTDLNLYTHLILSCDMLGTL